MSSAQYEVKCRQCGFPEAWKMSECRSNEWSVDCFRCGYHESFKVESRFSNGHLEKGVNKTVYSAGAYCARKTDNGGEAHGSLSEADLEMVAARIRGDIDAGRLSPKSYVTKFNFETGKVIAIVGEVPKPEYCDEHNPDDAVNGETP